MVKMIVIYFEYTRSVPVEIQGGIFDNPIGIEVTS
jgi:hypothetical protein